MLMVDKTSKKQIMRVALKNFKPINEFLEFVDSNGVW